MRGPVGRTADGVVTPAATHQGDIGRVVSVEEIDEEINCVTEFEPPAVIAVFEPCSVSATTRCPAVRNRCVTGRRDHAPCRAPGTRTSPPCRESPSDGFGAKEGAGPSVIPEGITVQAVTRPAARPTDESVRASRLTPRTTYRPSCLSLARRGHPDTEFATSAPFR